MYFCSADPDSWEHFAREIGDGLVERLDERSALCRLDEEFRPYFLQHRFPVLCEKGLDDAGFDTVVGTTLDLPWETLQGKRYALQLSANRRLDWPFGRLIPAWLERFGLCPEKRSDREPELIVSAHFQVRDTVRIFAGISSVSDNLSPWSRGVCRIPRPVDAVSRAESKLLEALELVGELKPGRALDMGAAPGGWTRVLVERGFEVDAVDPAELDSSVLKLPAAHHHRTTAGDYLGRNETDYRLIVCDMKMEPLMVADLLLDCGRRLAPDGAVIATLKLGKKGNPLPLLEQALNKIRRAYTVVQARQLYFNRREVTVIARPRIV